MIYGLTGEQLKDIHRYVTALNEADVSLENHPDPYGVKDMDWGDGFRAIMLLPAIPVRTDAGEFLGYIERGDFSYMFRAAEGEEGAKK
jgi:hypothetical protein